MKLERHLAGAGQHVLDARRAQHVGNFVRIGDRRHRAKSHGQLGERGRRHHAAFDVDVAVDEARQDELPSRHRVLFAPPRSARASTVTLPVEHALARHVDDVSGDAAWRIAFLSVGKQFARRPDRPAR